jgi:hypothetical protein
MTSAEYSTTLSPHTFSSPAGMDVELVAHRCEAMVSSSRWSVVVCSARQLLPDHVGRVVGVEIVIKACGMEVKRGKRAMGAIGSVNGAQGA